jgi:hypothetical protein
MIGKAAPGHATARGTKKVSSSRCHIAQNQPIFFIRWKIQRVEPNGLYD